MTRDLPALIDLAKRVKRHCQDGPWSQSVDARMSIAHQAWKADANPAVDDMNVYDYSRVHRWVASWTRRRAVVARALATRLRSLGVTPDMLRVP